MFIKNLFHSPASSSRNFASGSDFQITQPAQNAENNPNGPEANIPSINRPAFKDELLKSVEDKVIAYSQGLYACLVPKKKIVRETAMGRHHRLIVRTISHTTSFEDAEKKRNEMVQAAKLKIVQFDVQTQEDALQYLQDLAFATADLAVGIDVGSILGRVKEDAIRLAGRIQK